LVALLAEIVGEYVTVPDDAGTNQAAAIVAANASVAVLKALQVPGCVTVAEALVMNRVATTRSPAFTDALVATLGVDVDPVNVLEA
jgi:hypothetical protein